MSRSTSVHLKRIKRPVKNGRTRDEWCLRWAGTDGKSHCRKLGNAKQMTKREAERLRRDFQAKMDAGTVRRDRAKATTIKAFTEYYEDAIEGRLRPTTIDSYLLCLNHLAATLGSDYKIARINTVEVTRLVRYLRDRGVAAATLSKTIISLRCIFNEAKRWGLVEENPFVNERVPRVQPKRKRIFSREEIAALIEVAPTEWWRSFILLAASTGLRRDELLHLHWDDVDADRNIVTVTAKRADQFEVDGESYPILAFSAKSHQERSVPIAESVVAAVEEFREQSDGSPYVFLSLDRLRVIDSKLRRRRFELVNNLARNFHVIQKRASKRLGDDNWRLGCIHDLRRTFGTLTADAGVPLHVLQRWMGHQDIATTAKFYLDVGDHHGDLIRAALLTI